MQDFITLMIKKTKCTYLFWSEYSVKMYFEWGHFDFKRLNNTNPLVK